MAGWKGENFQKNRLLRWVTVRLPLHLHLVGVKGEDLHDLAGLVPPASLAILGLLVLDLDGVINREGREGVGANQEMILHPPVPLGHGQGVKVGLQAPLAPRLILAAMAGELVF